MAGSSRDYWIKREREAKKATIRDQEAYKKSIEDIYNRTYEAVERQINDWYAKYASKHGLTMAEARARVKKLDMERYERLAAKYVATHDFSDQANEEMEIYNLTMRINRLELLKAQINLELLAGYDDLDHEMQRQLIEQAMKEDRRLAGILGDSVIGNLEYAKQLVNASFQNATFSERIWGNNMPKLRSHIETELRNGIIQGIHPRELARRLRKSFDVSIADSERLMVTETRRIQTDIQKASFERNGFTEYRFITTGDERVCPDCEALHEQHFKVSEMQPGENAPPMHPMCRCSTAAYMDGEKYKRWLEALERGEDVRWDEFEAGGENSLDEDIYKILRTLTKRDEDRSRMSDKALEIASIRDATEQMHAIDNLLNDYCTNQSQWSGNLIIDDKMERWGSHNRKTHDITIRSDSPLKTKVHELLHARTIYQNKNISGSIINKYKPLNEAIIEVTSRGICKAEGIQVLNLSYPKHVRHFRNIAFIMGVNELKLGLSLIDIPYENRYDWIEVMLKTMENNNEISKKDYDEARISLKALIKTIGP